MKVIVKLIRHGETTGNKNDTFSGTKDDKMTPKGLQQCEKTAEFLRDWPIDLAFTSPLTRAKETAEIILKGRGAVPLIVDERIIERSFGGLQGLAKHHLKEKTEEEWGVESPVAVTERMLAFFDDLFPTNGSLSHELQSPKKSDEKVHIAIFNHGAAIKYFIHGLYERKYRVLPKYEGMTKSANCSIFTIEMEQKAGLWEGTVAEVGSHDHLEGLVTSGAVDQSVSETPVRSK